MISNYKNGTAEFKDTVDRLQEDVSLLTHFQLCSAATSRQSLLTDASFDHHALFCLHSCLLQMRCCGVNSSADWRSFTLEGNSVPDSCCLNVTTGCGMNSMTDANKVYQKVKSTTLVVTLRWLDCACLKSSNQTQACSGGSLYDTLGQSSSYDKIKILHRAAIKTGSS